MTQKQHENTEKENSSGGNAIGINEPLDEYLEISQVAKGVLDGDKESLEKWKDTKKDIEKIMAQDRELIQSAITESVQAFNQANGTDLENVVQVCDYTDKFIKRCSRIYNADFESVEDVAEYLNGKHTSLDMLKIVMNMMSDDEDSEKTIDLKTATPKTYVHTVDNLTNSLFDEKNNAKKEFNVPLRNKKKRQNIEALEAHVALIYDKIGEKESHPDRTFTMRSVLDGIVSNLYVGNYVMTYLMIYRAFSRDKKAEQLPDGVFELIEDTLKALDCWCTVKAKDGQTGFSIDYQERLLNYRKLAFKQSVILNGKKIDNSVGIIQVFEMPFTYCFARDYGGQIESREDDFFDVPGLNNTMRNIKIKNYLYHQVVIRKNNRKLSKSINIENYFKGIEADITNPNTKHDVMRATKFVLNHWKKIDLIENYEIKNYPGTRKPMSIEVNFKKKGGKRTPGKLAK